MTDHRLTRSIRFTGLMCLLLLLIIGLGTTQTFAAPGDLDPAFTATVRDNFGSPGKVSHIVTAPDGKIYISGDFNKVGTSNAPRLGIARLNPDGTVDSGFVPQGYTITDEVTGLALQSDGKIVVNMRFDGAGRMVRFNNDGSLDQTFNRQILSGTARAVAFQPGGKILVAGSFNSYGNDQRVALIRLNSDGTLDQAFNPVLTNTSGNAQLYAMTVQPDGKILIGGLFSQVNNVTRRNIARLSSDGLTDITFGGTGAGIGDGNFSPNAEVFDISLRTDGEIFLGGNFGSYNGVTRNRVVLINADGNLDAEFVPNTFFLDNLSVKTVQADIGGKVFVGGSFVTSSGGQPRNSLLRLTAGGLIDNTFSAIGTNQTGSLRDIIVQADGKILVGGEFATFNGSTACVSIARLSVAPSAATQKPIADFDGDGKSDVSVFRPSDGTWYGLKSGSNNLFFSAQFGSAEDKITPADFDGDGKTDLALFRPSSGTWYLQQSTNGYTSARFGLAEDIPAPADFDGDGKADLAVFRPSTGIWHVQRSNQGFYTVQFGLSGDVPQIGDFDGDGKADISVYRPSSGTWYRLNSANNQFVTTQFGLSTDIPTSADFDGDGKTDIAVFRPSSGDWYLQQSTNGLKAFQFGAEGDRPVAADFDGDGKADIGVFRPAAGGWYINRSAQGLYGVYFGFLGDVPAESAFVP